MTSHAFGSQPHHKVYWNTIAIEKIRIPLLGECGIDHEIEFRVVKRYAKRPDRTLVLKIGDCSRVEFLSDHHDRRSIPLRLIRNLLRNPLDVAWFRARRD